MPCTVDEATKCTLLWTQMLTKCKPNKGKSKTDPVYRIRGSFLKFLFQSYKACVNHRHPSRTGELKLMNDFIAKKIHQYIFGDTDKLIFTDGSQVFNTYFPKVEGKSVSVIFIYSFIFVQLSGAVLKKSRWPATHMKLRLC